MSKTGLGKPANSYEPIGLEGSDYPLEVFVAGFGHRCQFRSGQLVRRDVGATVTHPNERAEIDGKVLPKKGICGPKRFFRPAPESASADFRAGAGESGHRAFGVLPLRAFNRFTNTHPVAHCSDFSERHAGLCHSERAWIHAEKKYALFPARKFPDKGLMRPPRIFQWIIDVGDRQ